MNQEFLSGLGLEQETVTQIMDEYDRERQAQLFTQKLHEQVEQSGAKSVKATVALLNQEALSLEEGNVLGLSEQLSALKEEHPYLFDSKLPHAVASATGGGESERSLFSVIRSAAGL